MGYTFVNYFFNKKHANALIQRPGQLINVFDPSEISIQTYKMKTTTNFQKHFYSIFFNNADIRIYKVMSNALQFVIREIPKRVLENKESNFDGH